MLKRQGIIATWYDRKITAGSEIDNDISINLESSKVILLLISPYFLASDYCYEREMGRALEKHESQEAVIIPVILHPCDWHSSPFGKLLATPTDGKPVSMFANQHEAFAIVAKDIRNAVEGLNTLNTKNILERTSFIKSDGSTNTAVRSSNLCVKRAFSQLERDQFIDDTFDYIARYFEYSLAELQNRNQQIKTKYRKITTNRFSASIYVNGDCISMCSIWFGGQSYISNGILFSSSETISDNSYNECMNVTEDGYTLSLNSMGMSFTQAPNSQLSQEGAAEYFWSMLIERLQ
jgi:hypothetical protein